MLKRFISYYKPHKKLFIADMIASLFISVLGMIYPIITNFLVNSMEKSHLDYKVILYAGISVLVLYVIRMLLRYFVQYYGHLIGTRMQAQMRRDLFCHIEKLPFSYFDKNETGEILSRITNDLFDVAELSHHGPENLIISTITLIGSFIYLCTINVILTLIIFICVPFLIIISGYLRKRMKVAFKERRVTTAGINASIESSITGIRVTKAFGNREKEYEKFEKNNSLFVSACHDAYKAMALFHCSSTFITDVFNVVIIIAGGFFLHSGMISFGDYATFIVSVNVFINPVTQLISFMEQYQNGVSGFSRFCEIMDEDIEKEKETAKPIEEVKGEIVFKNVHFNYETSDEILEDINLQIGAGQKIALVGHSGGGKTTICHLIPAFYPVSKGEILLDGINIKDITLDSLRKHIGIVQQDVFLFSGTIRDNILYGRLDASEEEMLSAAKKAKIHDFVMSLEKGYDTEIGERGVRLSGGQKQRLSIARVFLKNPAILILDEATSALDNTTETIIQEALESLSEGRTTIIVAHRLSTVSVADEIVVVEEGKIAEKGTHQQLMEEKGRYFELYSSQFR